MKHFFLGTVAVLAMAMPFAVNSAHAAETYTLDPYHTNVYWKANHFGFSNPSGKFATVTGTVTLDEQAPDKSSVNVTINTGSVVTGIDLFNEHLRDVNFFNIAKFPTATFVSKKVVVTGKDIAKVEGDLTLLGVTKPVTLDVNLNKVGENPISKLKTAGFTATGVVKRSEFGMVYALPGVSDDVQITIDAEANIQPPVNK